MVFGTKTAPYSCMDRWEKPLKFLQQLNKSKVNEGVMGV